MAFEFKLPDIGEGLTEGEVVKWLVKEGDVVAEDQPMVEVMTDKATVEITVPRAGTISKINAQEGGRWVLRGDRGITYSADLPANATLEQGKWWAADHSGENLLSFSAEEADEVGVNVGDVIVVNVLGRNISARVSNLRHVEWQSMSMNFVMVFSPNTFAGAPHAHLATLRVGEKSTLDGEETDAQVKRDGQILKAVTTKFPTVTTHSFSLLHLK